MLESRSCQRASLGEEWEGGNWLISLELARAVPFSLSPTHNSYSSFPFRDSSGERGQRWQAGRAGQAWPLPSTVKACGLSSGERCQWKSTTAPAVAADPIMLLVHPLVHSCFQKAQPD